ncbi:tRNA (adenosine(37)-N6)-threonylcarbamoyltransferase complex dimerization subunit type 1 TsaB [Microvirga tunisiensis]|uniref:tRNA (Adenosine(37)-N6)-threonylcarbamoyltransferase complex dimerization subunit type 1 TsaB n=2 Tax=Pannonibacter tanglangensis TaxID=2750084 RepID=A0A7X5F5C0_9HYPH|nr:MULTISPECIES: tRNA (adenosine(37)-N6)-threonylcarbamoyltransferase complex dimerization subunit type 1 TsaB [unclassified Pannonibacter]NBN65740.1 tRNA (adenosine(37)-N6)-threonylcarbamoyltransferase complex dimerization subunit type 1 TsaB [Pannonibacter sp. XCT-34]NBN80033.1 tRNA (adenosine(37)-N6)-threonylcarbamoyltransferase complex dimerization subunit type 1 TsaB [Pannonibacter sp. XCT-53]
MNRLLAIDTAQTTCAAAVLVRSDGDSMLYRRSAVIGRGHAEVLLGMIGDVMAEAGCAFSDLSRIAVTNGPGSFTGLRVGLSVARGFALVMNTPVAGISTLDAIAREQRKPAGGHPLLVALTAREDEVYAALYGADGQVLEAPHVARLADLAAGLPDACRLAGSAAPALASAAGLPGDVVLTASAEADIGTIAWLGTEAPADAPQPVPLYLRPADAKPQTRGRIERI